MAFDRPLEADRVDDLNLFSTFIRAPVVGTLMWILGGDRARKEEAEERQRRDTALFPSGSCEEHVSFSYHEVLRSSNHSLKRSLPCKSSLKKAAPSLVGSETSDLADCSGGALDGIYDSSPSLVRPKKNLSWSDESGRRLVEFIDKSEEVVQVSDSRNVMTRSTSVRAHANRLVHGSDENSLFSKQEEPRYLPRGLDKEHNGIVMPRMPYGFTEPATSNASSSEAGVESPQWGWFMRTTPPTPQMYHSRAPTKQHNSSGDTSQTSTASDSSTNTLPMSQPNPIFQGLQDKNKTAPMGWSSVPL